MSDRTEFRFAGSGGQGLILAGIILADAAAIYENKNAVQTQSYGPEARGGSSKSEVIISDSPIEYPKATMVDYMVTLTQESFTKYIKDVKDSGIVIADKELVTDFSNARGKLYLVDMVKSAREELGKLLGLNIIALGVLVELSGIVSHESIEQALMKRVPKGFEDYNKKAIEIGFRLAKEIKKQ
ncbi:MAG: 2-oxoacid:acceptor oxidoreductase family protein [Deltaproteobacteria bacterium]|jgi:2-oxoglutarate ferredoxin oxidoreductase subunit gamma|nr:2-oxoacid:acceptor oxidoreductase family protein [Deltaproteobacteria bacterium]MCL5879274.1 2-oxoacid:acceptor oxidoreductase family protein [Deltaproteobacteria bacterium]MDA8304943.1 2-oxoacid:acceptor oxidoreductase family protein [Deltaproteobacteria bacterium]